MSGCLDPDPSIALELAGTALTARVNLSTTPGNAATIASGGLYVQGGFVCAVRRASSNQAFTAPQSALAVSWDTEDFDTGGCFDVAQPTRLTCPVSGVYQITAYLNVTFTTYSAGLDGIKIRANGATELNDVTDVSTIFATPPKAGNRGLWADAVWLGAFASANQKPLMLSGRFRANALDYVEVLLSASASTGASTISGSAAATGGASGAMLAFLHPTPTL